MAYRLRYSDYSTEPETGPPDPTRWQGPPGPQGPQGVPGPEGPEASGGPFLPLTGGTVSGDLIAAGRVNISNIPAAKADGSPPDGAVKGDIYNNGGFLCIAR